MSATAYDWVEENGVLTILDVEVMSRLSSETREGLAEGDVVDDEYLMDMVERTKRRIASGKPPQLLLRHNPDSNNAQPAAVIGRLARPTFRNGWIHADLVVTNPEQQERIKRGELPNKSAEFYMKQRKLWGLSLIEGEEGHFGDLCPDLVLKNTLGEIITAPESFVLDSTEKGDTLFLQVHNAPIKLAKRQTMAKMKLNIKGFHEVTKLQGGSVEVQPTAESEVIEISEQPTAEEVVTVAAAAAEPAMTEVETLKAQIAKLQEEIEALKKGDVALMDEDKDDDKEELADDEADEKEKMSSQAKKDAEYLRKEADRVRLSKLVDSVKDAGSVLERDQIAEKLSKFTTAEGREQHAELLKLQTKGASSGTPEDNSGDGDTNDYKTKLAKAHQESSAWKDKPVAEYEAWLVKRGFDHSLRA